MCVCEGPRSHQAVDTLLCCLGLQVEAPTQRSDKDAERERLTSLNKKNKMVLHIFHPSFHNRIDRIDHQNLHRLDAFNPADLTRIA